MEGDFLKSHHSQVTGRGFELRPRDSNMSVELSSSSRSQAQCQEASSEEQTVYLLGFTLKLIKQILTK